MRLKRLELQGFKTFASRTEFVFDTGVTAIVGPNGSGKSNVADALRWVLGEQSFGLLRGKRTEDMIFAGSDRRAEAGMAQATLILDNSDNWLPIEYSEVTIVRRAYRSGENEYLVNGSRVRLRDVSDLLARSGLAQRTYAIIGQGLIDAALALRSEERRSLFEEAAGIGLYQSKRDEALRKLDTTARNLERVRDLLAELGPRLKALERQAQRARDSDQIQAELLRSLQVWYGYRWQQAQAAWQVATQVIAERMAERDAAREASREIETQLAALQSEISTVRQRWNGLNRERTRLSGELEAARREVAVDQERNQQLTARQMDLQQDLANLQTERQARLDLRLQAEAELARITAELAERQSAAQAAQQELAARQAQRAGLQTRLDQSRRQSQRLSTEVTDRQARLGQVLERRDTLARESGQAGQTLAAAVEKYQAAETELAQINTHLTALEQDLHKHHQERQRQQAELTSLEKSLAEARRRLAEAQAASRRLTERRDLLDRTRKEMAGYAAGTRAVLRAAQTGQLPGVRGAVAELFRVPPELERAIEAVLGAELGAVVVDDWPTARAAARLLATGAGRTTLLPLTELQSRALDLKRLTGEPGQATVTADGDPNLAVQLASAVVEADSAIRPAVEFLLNRTVLAPNRNIARQLAAVLPPGARAVSPDGDVWLAGSGLITGSLGGEAASGPGALAREREWRELPEHIQRATAEHERQASQVAEVEHHIRNQRTTLTQIERLLSKVENERRTLRSQREAASRAVERQAQQVEWSRNRLAEIEREQAEVDQRAAEFTEQLVTLRQELEAAEASTRKIEMALAELSLAELQARVTAAQQTAALVAQAQRTQRETVEARQREVAASDNQIAARSQRLHELETEVARLAHSLESARARETELAVRVAALEAEIRPTEARLAELDGARSSADETARKLRARLQTVEQSAAQAQLESSRRQAEVDDLRRRIQDELGPVELPAQEGQISQPLLPFEPGVSRLPVIQELPKGLEDTLQKLRGQLKRIGPVNPEAAGEYTEAEERFRFLSDQVSDLETASAGLQSVIAELDRLTERDFQRTFEAVAAEFKRLFTRLFGGGQARLVLTDPEHLTTSGVDIIARIPGRRPQPLALLSGGERTLTAAALIFSILRVAPTPFCVLDEVDAMLDEANVGRFRELLEELSARTQFIVITHNRGTVEAAHTIYGISMRSDGASQVLSLRLEDVEEIRSPNGKAEIDS